MPIQTPVINTNINNPEIPNANRDMLLRMLLQGQQGGIEQANKSLSQEEQSQLDTQGKNQDLKRLVGALKSGDLPEGASVVSGTAHVGQDPTAKLAQTQQKNEAQARSQASKLYNDSTKSIGDRLGGAQELTSALNSNDPNSRGKVVQAYMTMQGFKRFNTPESYALAPPSIQEQIAQGAAKFGINPTDLFKTGALTPQQRHMFAKDGIEALQSFKSMDEDAKQKALSSYGAQTYATPQGSDAISHLGGSYGGHMDQISKGLSKHIKPEFEAQPTAGPDTASSGGGFMDKIGGAVKSGLSSLGIGAQASPQPQAQAPAQAQPTAGIGSLLQKAPAAPQAPVDPLTAELKRRGLAQ